MKEKFTVIEGGRNNESKALVSAQRKIWLAVEPFAMFDDITSELSDKALYNSLSDDELAYEAELLSGKLQNPGNELGDLLSRAIALNERIALRLSA